METPGIPVPRYEFIYSRRSPGMCGGRLTTFSEFLSSAVRNVRNARGTDVHLSLAGRFRRARVQIRSKVKSKKKIKIKKIRSRRFRGDLLGLNIIMLFSKTQRACMIRLRGYPSRSIIAWLLNYTKKMYFRFRAKRRM